MSNQKTIFLKWLHGHMAQAEDQIELEKEAAEAPPTPATTTTPENHNTLDYDYDAKEEPYVPVGINGVLAASERLLAVNKGLANTDFRDSQVFKKNFEPDRQLWERIRTDRGGVRKKILRMMSSRRNLSSLMPFYFDGYSEKQIVGNSLSTPLEEINPIHLAESARRITQMGEGGIKSSDSITSEMQCHSVDTEVFTKEGWKFWPEVTEEDELACRVNGVLEFHRPDKLIVEPYKGIMYGAKSRSINYLVTPNHRFYTASSQKTKIWKWLLADEHHGKYQSHLATAEAYVGNDSRDIFDLQVEGVQDGISIDMGDWCEFLGWYLSEGSCYHGKNGDNQYTVTVTQCPTANPAKWNRIKELFDRLPFNYVVSMGRNFRIKSKVLFTYVKQFGRSYDKFVPEFVFEVKPTYRRRLLDAFLAGDGHTAPGGNKLYSSSSEKMIDHIERLLVLAGSSTSRGNPWVAKKRDGTPSVVIHRTNELTTPVKTTAPKNQFTEEYDGLIYCATVPGSLLLTRRGGMAFWNGNSVHPSQFGFIDPLSGPESEKAGVDVRVSWGAKMGSDGRIYQLYRNRRTGRLEYKSPADLDGYNVKLPD